mmetsp:Transcript_23271/g.30389  ORF Transcript_23271/g.30389 Transcript_23271/m.30389 type:complete len:171 (-) Transcript_23271:978-1490(-)
MKHINIIKLKTKGTNWVDFHTRNFCPKSFYKKCMATLYIRECCCSSVSEVTLILDPTNGIVRRYSVGLHAVCIYFNVFIHSVKSVEPQVKSFNDIKINNIIENSRRCGKRMKDPSSTKGRTGNNSLKVALDALMVDKRNNSAHMRERAKGFHKIVIQNTRKKSITVLVGP